MGQPLRVLLIEDSKDDAELVIHALRRGGFEPQYDRVTTARELQRALKEQAWDVALCDYNLPELDGRQALTIVNGLQPDIAVIFVSGIIGEETAAELMRSGAKDYVRKDNLVRLNSAIERELKAAEIRQGQRKTGEKLEYERKLLRHLMDGIPDAIYFKDAERRYTRLNAAELRILNADCEENVTGRREDEFMPPGRAASRRAEDERLLATGEPLADCLESFEQADGSVMWFSENRAPLRDESGAVIGLAGIRRNVTQLKRHERMLARSNLHLEEFAHVASHDLRSPLRAIANTVEWLGEDLGEGAGDEIREHLDRLRLQARRATNLVTDLHNYSKAGRKKEMEEPVDLSMMVGEIFQSLPAARSMRLEFEGEPASLVTAKAPLDLVLRNLIDNAVKYHDRANGRISVRCKADNVTVSFEVEDDGPGIAGQYHQLVFQPFQKLESYEEVSGSGLGLATVKKTIEHFGCTIGLHSPISDGRGTKFVFDWPLRIPCDLLMA
jgi:PAS domain S-box-containing protein